jgi:hypothetical protein
MYDRPTAAELIEAARQHIENAVMPVAKAANHKLYFQTLVAANVMRIVERELLLRGTHLRAEWARLNMLLGGATMPESSTDFEAVLIERNALLCAAIRAGNYDTDAALFEHLKATTLEQLEVANPKYLAALQAEDASRQP